MLNETHSLHPLSPFVCNLPPATVAAVHMVSMNSVPALVPPNHQVYLIYFDQIVPTPHLTHWDTIIFKELQKQLHRNHMRNNN